MVSRGLCRPGTAPTPPRTIHRLRQLWLQVGAWTDSQEAGSVPHTPGAAGQFPTQTPSIPLAAAGSELGTQESPTRGGGGRAGAGTLAGAAL